LKREELKEEEGNTELRWVEGWGKKKKRLSFLPQRIRVIRSQQRGRTLQNIGIVKTVS